MSAQASAASSADEYDSLPDPFEGVDFDQVPELCGATGDASSDYDDFFDDLDTSELDRVPHLGPLPAGTADTLGSHNQRQPSPPPPNPLASAAAVEPTTQRMRGAEDSHPNPVSQAVSQATAASTQYMFDEIDETFLQEVSVVEQDAAVQLFGSDRSHIVLRNTSSERRQPSGPVAASNRTTQESSFKRKRSDLSSAPATPSKRRKSNSWTKSDVIPETVDLHASARRVLSGIEEELNCPICCDVLATTYTTNPCGHSCCGDCLLQWLDTSQKPWSNDHPTCPVCRTRLDHARPAVRSIVTDNVVRQYVFSAEEVGVVDWQPTGNRRRTFLTRSNHSVRLADQFAQLPNTFPLSIEIEDPEFGDAQLPQPHVLELSMDDNEPEGSDEEDR